MRKVFLALILSLSFAVSAYSQADLPSGATDWLTFDGEFNPFYTGTVISCACQGEGCTTIETCKFDRGKVGQGIRIRNPNAEGVFMTAPNDASNSPTSGLTIEGWFKLNNVHSVDNYQQTLVSKRIYDENFYLNQSYLLEVVDGQPRASHGCLGANENINAFTFINSNTWYHLAFTLDPAAHLQKIYVNGVDHNVGDQSEISNLGLCYDNNSPLIFGGVLYRDDTYANFIDGSMDEVTLYSRALSESEIQSIYNEGFKGKKKQKDVSTGTDIFAHLGDLDLTFQLVTTGGTAQQTPLDLGDFPALPPNTTPILGYDVTTTTVHSGNITLCYSLPLVNDPVQFSRLQILHLENGVWVNRTTSRDFPQRKLCGVTSSLSPFAIVDNLAPTAANVSVGGQVTNSKGQGISNVRISLTGSNGAARNATTNSFGFYHFDEVATGATYVLTANSKRYSFESPTQIVSVSDNISDLNFIAD